MTHLLSSILAGIGARPAAEPAGGSSPSSGTGSTEGFEQMLNRKAETAPDPDPHRQADGNGEDRQEPEQESGATHRGSRAGDRPNESSGPHRDTPLGMTLLGGSFGSRVRVPALTFILPAGSGPQDMAEAIRTQVLRFTAVRNLDPGSLDNLRLAISSRELGQVEVDLSVRGEKLNVDIVASGRESETALRKTSGELREGILARTDRFRQVDVKVSTKTAQEEDQRQQADRDSGRDRERERPASPGNPDLENDTTEDDS